MTMIVACAGYEAGRRIADLDLADSHAFLSIPGRFVWIGLHEPDEAILATLQQQFGLHPLAVEDAFKAHQRPKIDVFGASMFMVMRTAQLVGDNIEIGETHIFAGEGYVITVRHGASSSYEVVRARCEAEPELLVNGEDFVLYAIMDFIVDNYVDIVEAMEPQVEEIDEQVRTSCAGRATIDRIAILRRDLMRVRRVTAPLLDICNRLQRFELPFIDDPVRPYYGDVRDHVIRVNENIDILRDTLKTSFETFLLLGSNRQNEVMRQLAGWAAILAVPTAVAGIYGMNFEHMPELALLWGYPAVLLFIAVVCGALYLRFRRMGWL